MNLKTKSGLTGVSRWLMALACSAFIVLSPAIVAAADAERAGPMQLTLEDAVRMAIENSDNLAIAQAKADADMARLGQARAGFFPSLSASASYTRIHPVPYFDLSGFSNIFTPLLAPFQYLVDHGYLDPSTLEGLQPTGGATRQYVGRADNYNFGVSVNQPLFTGGALLSSYGAARHGARAGELTAVRTRESLRYAVVQAYVGLLQSNASLASAQDMERQVRSHLADAEAMYKQGMLLESDLLAVRVRASQVELDRTRSEHLVAMAKASLASVMGIDVETDIEPVDKLEPTAASPGDIETLTQTALQSRPDLNAARELVGAADNAVTIARSNYFPQLVLSGSYDWTQPNYANQQEFYDHWSVTLALQMKVFDWGLTSNKVREARAALIQAERGKDSLADAVRLDVLNSRQRLDEAITTVTIADSGLTQARESMRVAREGFRNGTVTNTSVLAAQAALSTAEVNWIASLGSLKTAQAALALATGQAASASEDMTR
jgi:outer membrane protein